MSIIKSFSVGNGDMFCVRHNSDNFSIIDCNIDDSNKDTILDDIKEKSFGKGVTRFICTHPDQDHFGGLEALDDEIYLNNFYVVKNQAIKDDDTKSFKRYCALRDSDKAFFIYKDCKRHWMNQTDDQRGSSGINILWPDIDNQYYKKALCDAEGGIRYNNISAIIRYRVESGASFLWLGDLETEFMEKITDEVDLRKTTVVFAAHHGRKSGKIPDSWLKILDPQIIVIGEAPSRDLNYYTGYVKITQNLAKDITMDVIGDKVHIYSSSETYSHADFDDEEESKFNYYVGSITVETEYTL